VTGNARRLGVQLAVFPRESTRWRAEPVGGHPGSVVLTTAGTDTVLLDIHLDRVTITRMQSALEGALADLDRDFPAA
jgi:hypothetical protein